jgi:hypothetical protein
MLFKSFQMTIHHLALVVMLSTWPLLGESNLARVEFTSESWIVPL